MKLSRQKKKGKEREKNRERNRERKKRQREMLIMNERNLMKSIKSKEVSSGGRRSRKQIKK